MRTCKTACVILGAAATLAATDALPVARGEDEPISCADVLESIRDWSGRDEAQAAYFEMLVWGKSVGYAMYTLEPRREKGDEGYDLSVTSAVQMPRSSRIETTLTARLDSTFQPLEVEQVKRTVSPDGTRQRTRQAALIEADIVSLEQQVDGGAVYGNTVDAPERPFVVGIEFIVARLDPKEFKRFELREFDPRSGEATVHKFKSKRREEGGWRIRATRADGVITCDIVRDDTGTLLSVKDTLPLERRATSRQRVEKLERDFDRR